VFKSREAQGKHIGVHGSCVEQDYIEASKYILKASKNPIAMERCG
jgi:hypothetical protein